MVKIVEKSQICSNLSKIFNFGQNRRKLSILATNLKKSLLIKISENVYFSQNYQKDFDFGQNFKKSWFWSKFTKISDLVKIFPKSQFWIFDFVQNLPKCRFWTKLQKMLIIVKFFENVDFGQNLQISRFWSKFMKISILVRVHENFSFGQNCRKILILVNIFRKSRFQSISLVKSIWDKIFPKSWLWSKFRKNGSKFTNMSILVKRIPKISILVKIHKYVDFW